MPRKRRVVTSKSLVCGRTFSLKVNENVAKWPFETVNFFIRIFYQITGIYTKNLPSFYHQTSSFLWKC